MKKNVKVVVYGFGATGKKVVDSLLLNKIEIIAIIDKALRGNYKNISIIGLEDLKINFKNKLSNVICLIGLHNHYINISPIYNNLISYGFSSVKTIVSFNNFLKDFNAELNIENSYWYRSDFLYENHDGEIEKVKDLLADAKSIEIYSDTIKYRRFGILEDCPIPSLDDEYIPKDLPKHKEPIRLIDCGAHIGTAIDRIYNNGFTLDSILAFEPNINNYNILSEKTFGDAKITFLPLGLWKSNSLLSFANTNIDATSGSLSENGDELIQCVRLDSVLKNHRPNLILFDIEGSEFDALIGMERIIKECRPTLCISIYHRPMDIYEIPLLINGWDLDYKFHIRVHEYNSFGLILYCFPN